MKKLLICLLLSPLLLSCSPQSDIDKAKELIQDLYQSAKQGNVEDVFSKMINIPQSNGSKLDGNTLYQNLKDLSANQPKLLESVRQNLQQDAKDAKISFGENIKKDGELILLPVKVYKNGKVEEQIFTLLEKDGKWKIDIEKSSYLIEQQ